MRQEGARALPLDGVEDAEQNKDPGEPVARVFLESGDGSELGRSFRHRFLDRLVGIARDRGIHLAELRCFGNPAVVASVELRGVIVN